MKAIRFHNFGDADILKLEETPKPIIGANDVLLQIKAAALNHLDLWVRSGAREKNIPLPHIPGSDGAGVIAEVGSAVDFFKVGDKVLISPGISCGHCEMCLGGTDNLCRSYHVLGTKEDGTYSEFVKLAATNVLPIPDGLDFNQAAAIPLVFLTAWHMLVGISKIKPGEAVLVHAAGSGVGSAGIQIAKLFGAHVITTAGSEEKLKKAKTLGAVDVINYKEKDFVEEVKRLTNKRGRLVTCGATSDYDGKIDLRFVYAKHLTLYGSFMGTKRELIDVLRFFKKGAGNVQLQPVVDSVFPLEKAVEAHRRMEERKNFGKIVLSI